MSQLACCPLFNRKGFTGNRAAASPSFSVPPHRNMSAISFSSAVGRAAIERREIVAPVVAAGYGGLTSEPRTREVCEPQTREQPNGQKRSNVLDKLP